MTVYQLVAVGHLELTQQQVMVYSDTVYRSSDAAEAAIPAYKEYVQTPKPNNELMKLTANPLRVFIKPLEVV